MLSNNNSFFIRFGQGSGQGGTGSGSDINGVRIHVGVIEPTDTNFWYDPSDVSEVVRTRCN